MAFVHFLYATASAPAAARFAPIEEETSALASASAELAEVDRLLQRGGTKARTFDQPPPSTCVPAVENLGCVAEDWPPVYERVYQYPAITAWKTESPVECACMCRIRYGSDFYNHRKGYGIVALGKSAGWGTCTCLMRRGGTGFAGSPWDTRGTLPPECCPVYDGVTETVTGGDVNGVDATGHPTLPHCKAKGGSDPNRKWTQRSFKVALCDGCSTGSECDTSESHRLGTMAWSKHTPCAMTSTDHVSHCDGPAGGAQDLRFGVRKAVDLNTDVFLAIDRVPARAYSTDQQRAFAGGAGSSATSGVACSSAAILATSLARDATQRKRGLDIFAAQRSMPRETTAAEARALVRASTKWMCKHAPMFYIESFNCWRATKTTAAAHGCTPPLPGTAGEPKLTQLVRQCARDVRSASDAAAPTLQTFIARRAAQVAIGRAFIAVVTRDLAHDVVANMRGFCPDLKALRGCLEGLLPAASAGTVIVTPTTDSGKRAPKRTAMAILVPYRNRPTELRKWLWWTLPLLLRRGARPFGIFVVEEIDGPLWNKARILNAGVAEVRKLSPLFDCFVFADVDLVMQAPRSALKLGHCAYDCDESRPLHLSTLLRGYGGTTYDDPPSLGVFCDPKTCSGAPEFRGAQSSGGVVALTHRQVQRVNGWTNSIWGWGGEDSNLDRRIRKAYTARPAPIEIAMQPGNEKCVFIHLADEDSVVKGEPGVNKPSFRRAGGGYAEIAGKYNLVKTTTHPLYTMLTIDPKFGTS